VTPNQKLSRLITGRAVTGSSIANDILMVRFSDGSQMNVTIADGTSVTVPEKTVSTIYQNTDDIDIAFSDGTFAKIALAEQNANISVRSAAGALQYVG
jgi:hypothetical protein